ncbi:MAG: two-component regulator propeller domain-containing protein [Bacteroidia bacterium]
MFYFKVESCAQSMVPATEGWRVHLPFANNNALTESGNKIYVGSPSGIFTFNEKDKSIEVLSKVSGLSDVEVSLLASDPVSGIIAVIYQDANIDIIQSGTIFNISDIFAKVMIGTKRINNVSFHNNKVYLSCSFGIVVIDLGLKMIIDSYIGLGVNGADLEVLDVEFYQNYIYASTAKGINRANQNELNLSDYHKWSQTKSSQFSSLMAVFHDTLYAVVDSVLQTSVDGINFNPYAAVVKNPISLNINHENLVSVTTMNIFVEDQTGYLHTFNLPNSTGGLLSGSDELYAIGYNSGLVYKHPDGSVDYFAPPGPFAKTAMRMAYNQGDNSLWVAGGSVNNFGTSSGWGPTYNNNKFYRFIDNLWINYKTSSDTRIISGRDFTDVSVNPLNNHIFLSSFLNGIFELTASNGLINVYDTGNSSMKSMSVSGACFDKFGNMWVSNFGATNPISVRTAGGQWYSYKLPSVVDGMQSETYLGFITTDDYNNKWVFSTHAGGIIVFNDNGHPEYTPASNQFKMLQKDKQKGYLPSNTVLCVTKDQKGEMWVGTDQGLCIFSNPGNIFVPNADYDSHQLVIKTGLVYSNFLGTEAIYCIRLDAANRKWIGTRNGAWLVSPDGYTVLKNFTTANSPLLSNIIYDIGINDKTGEVFFATDKGMISYMGNATAGGDTHGDVIVYPNPVRPEYQGLIAIRGLVNNAHVKITDIAGNLVYEAISNGGMITWNAQNFNGKRVATGVYLIYSSNDDASDTWVGKILVIN